MGSVVVTLLVFAAVTGCAIGNIGTLAANVQRHDSLSVMSVYSVGLHVRTRQDDLGTHLGYSSRTYAFPPEEALPTGWHFLRTPSPAGSAIAQDLITLGVDVSPAAPEVFFSVGYVHTRLLARVPVDASMLIEYSDADMRITNFKTCPEATPCAIP